MIVEIFEPFSGGHHTKYIALLLPTLVSLKERGFIHRLVVTTSTTHRESAAFTDRLAQYADAVDFEFIEGNFRSEPGRRVTDILFESLERNKPNFLIVTSANNGALTLAVRSLVNKCFKRADFTSVGIIHNGFSRPATHFKDRFRDNIHRFSRKHAPWSEMYIVNPVLFERILLQGDNLRDRVKMLPDPVQVPDPVASDARQILGLPAAGRIIGMIGQSDGRKAIPELLAAFRDSKAEETDRLLLAGTLYEPYRLLIHKQYADLLESGRVILIDRYLHPHELQAANFASDVVAVTYYTDELSSNLLAAVAARRPVIGSFLGYSGLIIGKFQVGWQCDVFNHASFTSAVSQAFNACHDYVPSTAAQRLLAYHDPDNFVSTLLARLYELLDLPTHEVKSWNWVVHGATK